MIFDIDQAQDYFEQLCREHKLVDHEINGQRSFARLQTSEHINEIKNNGGPNIVVVAAYSWRRMGRQDERMRRTEIILRVACYASKETDAATAKKEALSTAEQIVDDFVGKMEQQQLSDMENNICGPMRFLEAEDISCEEIEDQPWFLNHFGFDLVVPFKTFAPGYNPENWRTE